MAEKKIINTELQPIDKLLDSSGDAGTSGQILSSTGSGTNWINAGGGTITGSGSQNYIPLWSSGTVLTNSIISSTGGDVTINGSDDNPYIYINPAGGDIGDTARVQFNSRGWVGYIGGFVELGDAGQSKDIRLRVNTAQIYFQTSNTTRMTITTAGKVGIGTQSPGSPLHIAGTSGSVAGSAILFNGSTAIWQPADTSLAIRPAGGDIATFTSTGVGIGTGSPGHTLDVKGPDSDNATIARFYSNTSSRGSFGIVNGSGVNPTVFIGTLGGSEELALGVNGVASGEVIRIDASENVGIGTTQPAYKLDVAGVIKATSSIRVDAGSPYFGLYNSGTEKAYLQWSQTGSVLTLQSDGAINYTSGGLQKWTISGTQLLTLTTGGDLQIGTTTVITSGRRFYSADGSVSAPAYSFSGFTDDGMYREAYDTTKSQLSFATEGTRRGRIGEFGIWSDANVYASSQFRSFANPWYATAGTSGAGFKFTNTADSNDLLNIDGSGNATFLGKASSAQTASSDGNSVLTTKSYVDGLVTGVTRYMGLWDASSGTGGSPDLTASTYKVPGYYFIVSVAGNAEPNGAGTEPDTWHVGDWVIWSDQATDAWQKIDNTSVLSGTGTANKVAMWNGDESLTNAPITISSNDSTFGGNITIPASGTLNFSTDIDLTHSTDTLLFQQGGSDRFKVSGDVGVVGATDFYIPQGRKLKLDGVSGHTYIEEESDSNLKFYVGGTERMNITGGITYSQQDIDMNDNDITSVNKINFEDGIELFGAGNNNYLKFKSLNANNGGILFQDGDSTIQGYLYYDGGATSAIGFLSGAGEWAVRCIENDAVELRYDNSIKFQTASGGVAITGDVMLNDNEMITWGGNSIIQHTGAITYIGDNSSGSAVSITGGNTTFEGSITIGGSSINKTGDLTLDVSGDITLDADGGDIFLKDAGSTFGQISNSSQDLIIKASTNDKDINFDGFDNGSGITALRLDMSDSGWAHFNTGIAVGNLSATSTFSGALQWGNGKGLLTYGSDRAIMRSASSQALELQTNGGTTLMVGVDANATFAGNVYLAGTKKLFLTDDGTNNYIVESSDNVIDFVSAGVVGLQLSGTSADMRSVNFNGHITTETDSTFNIGSTSKRFANIWVDNINGGTPTTGGPYLPLSGGTITGGVTMVDDVGILFGSGGDSFIKHTGAQMSIYNDVGHMDFVNRADNKDIVFNNDDGSGGTTQYFRIDGDTLDVRFSKPILLFDNVNLKIGAGQDLELHHDATDSYMQNSTGHLYFLNYANDKDIIFKSDNGSGGVTEYLRLDGGITSMVASVDLLLLDSIYLKFGNSQDFTIGHNATDTYLTNATGDLEIINNQDDGDIIFKSDDGSGGNATYFYLDGGNTRVQFNKDARFVDDKRVMLGTSDDLQIYHSSTGTGSFIVESGPGDLEIYSDTEVHLKSGALGENYAKFTKDGPIELYYDNSKKFETTNTGISVADDISLSGEIKGRSIPCLFNSNFSDGTSSTIQVVPFNSLTEAAVSSRTYYHNITMPYAGKLTKVVMKNVSGSPSSSFTTQLFFYVNGSQQASSAELTISSDKIEWSPTASNTFSAGDELSFGYQKSASNKTWSGVSYGVAIELTNYDI